MINYCIILIIYNVFKENVGGKRVFIVLFYLGKFIFFVVNRNLSYWLLIYLLIK